jgi:membrane fusion protein, multidrug efflux system
MNETIATNDHPEPRETTKALVHPVSAPARRSHPLRRTLGGLLLALVLAGIAAGVYLWWEHSRIYVWTDNAYVVGNITQVAAEVGGTVVALYTDDNVVVQSGDPLAQLDPVPYQIAVDQAVADLAQARSAARAAGLDVQLSQQNQAAILQGAEAKLAEYTEILRNSRLDVDNKHRLLEKSHEARDALKAQMPGTEALAQNAMDYRNRFNALAARGDVSVQQRDDREAAYRDAKAKVESLEANIAAADRQVQADQVALDAASVKVKQAQQTLEQARSMLGQAKATQIQPRVAAATAEAQTNKVSLAAARLEQARLQLGYTLVRAPQSGIVSRRTIQLGQAIAPRQSFLSIVPLDLNNVWVVANLREDQMNRVRIGQPATVHVDAISERSFAGYVESVAGGTGAVFSLFPPDNATGNFVRVVQRLPVRIRFTDPENWHNRIRPGMSVGVTIDTTEASARSSAQR